MKKVINAAAAILCALGVGGGILSCSGGTNYVGTSGSSTPPTPPTNSEPVADSWNFVTASPDILYDGGTSVANSAKAIIAAGTNTGASDGITYSLANDATIKGADEKLTLTLQSAKVTAGSMTSSAIPVYSYADASGLRIKYNALKISNVVGNVILTVNLAAAGDSGRNLEVTVGTGGTTKTYPTSDKNAHEARFELACGTGSDVYIGASNNYWIASIDVAIDSSTFTSQTDSSTANDAATLGLEGTTVSSGDEGVATAAISSDGKIVITSKGKGSTTITVSNGTGNATIPVTVNTAGAITIGTIGKYSAATTGSWTLKGLSSLGDVTLSTSATVTLTEDATITADSGSLVLTASKGTGVGTTTGGASYKSHSLGTVIKKDALKISDVKGNVTLTVKWGVTSVKTSADRSLEVTIGDTGTTVSTPINYTDVEGSATGTKAQDDYVVNISGGDGTNVYIGASNELFIESISITAQ